MTVPFLMLEKSVAIDAKEHMASIGLSMASLQIELGQTEVARQSLKDAKASASNLTIANLKKKLITY